MDSRKHIQFTTRILNRLEEIGWRDEAEKIMSGPSYYDTFSDHKLVKQSKKLTEHGTENAISSFFGSFLNGNSVSRVEKHQG